VTSVTRDISIRDLTMATSSKQYKAIGEDLWKGRTEKIVRSILVHSLFPPADIRWTWGDTNRMPSYLR